MKNWKTLFFVFEGIVLYVFLYYHISIPCFFKLLFSVPCPGCGMTRAFREIFNFHFISAFSFNILAIPLFLYLLFFNILLFYDIFFKKNISLKYIKFIENHSIYLIFFLILSLIVNIIRGI